MEHSLGFIMENSSGRKVCRILKSLYGLKQASHQWNLKLTEALLRHGYKQSKSYYSLFSKINEHSNVFLLIYVDDLLNTRSDYEMIQELKVVLYTNFKLKDLGNLRYFLRLEVTRSREGLVINIRCSANRCRTRCFKSRLYTT